MAKSELGKRKVEIEGLVKEAQDGSHDSFAKVYDIFIDPIYRYVFYRVKAVDAEDIVETVFLKVWEHLGKYKVSEKSSFSAWIFRIAHNLVVDYYRSTKNKGVDELLETIPDKKREHNPIDMTQQGLDRGVVKKAIFKLKKNYQEIIIYKFINDLSNKEIANILKRSEGSVRILQFRALKALKFELEDLGVNQDL